MACDDINRKWLSDLFDFKYTYFIGFHKTIICNLERLDQWCQDLDRMDFENLARISKNVNEECLDALSELQTVYKFDNTIECNTQLF